MTVPMLSNNQQRITYNDLMKHTTDLCSTVQYSQEYCKMVMSTIDELNKKIFLKEIFHIVFVQIPSVPNTKVVTRVNEVDMIEPIRGNI